MATAPKSDAECIQSAYEDQMNAIFKQFFMGVTGDHDDKKHLTSFKLGYDTLKHVKLLALSAIGKNTMTFVADVEAAKPARRRTKKKET